MLEKLKQYLRNYKDNWLTHWHYMPLRNRLILSTKIAIGFITITIFTILGIWTLLGSPSSTAELKRNIDHHLRFSKSTIQSLEASGDLPTLNRSVEIAGPDIDKNGIRDDIDAYIDRKAKEGAWTPEQIKTMQQDAKAMQTIVTVDVKNKKALDRADKMQTNSGWCKALQFGNRFDYPEYDLEPLTINTKERIVAYISYNNALIVVEDLQVKNMSKSAKGTAEKHGRNVKQKAGLNRSILDQGWANTRVFLEYKQEWRGGMLLAVPPQYTSQTCPACGHVSAKNRLTQSQFECVECGFSGNADHLAAINILERGHRSLACLANDATRSSATGYPAEATQGRPLGLS